MTKMTEVEFDELFELIRNFIQLEIKKDSTPAHYIAYRADYEQLEENLKERLKYFLEII